MTHKPSEPARRAALPTASGADQPRILSLPRQRSHAVSLRDLLDAVVAERAAEHAAAALPAVRVTLDVPVGQTVDADVELVRSVLAGLVGAAFSAAVAPARRGGPPVVREVVITSIDAADALEVEVADSGIAPAADRPSVTDARALVDSCGGELVVTHCPEGGTAVTLRLAHRRSHRRAA